MRNFDLKNNKDIAEILELLESGATIMVQPYDDDYDEFTGITEEDFLEDTEEEIIQYLLEKDEVQFWDDDIPQKE